MVVVQRSSVSSPWDGAGSLELHLYGQTTEAQSKEGPSPGDWASEQAPLASQGQAGLSVSNSNSGGCLAASTKSKEHSSVKVSCYEKAPPTEDWTCQYLNAHGTLVRTEM